MKKWSCLLLRWGGRRKNRFAGKIKNWVLGMLPVRCLLAPKWRNWVGKRIDNSGFQQRSPDWREKVSHQALTRELTQLQRRDQGPRPSLPNIKRLGRKGQISQVDYKAVTTEVGRKPWVLEGKWTKDIQEEEAIHCVRCWWQEQLKRIET